MIIDKGTDLSFQVKLVDVDNTEIQPSEVSDLSVRVFTTDEDACIIASVDSEGWVSVSSNQLDSLKSGVIAYSCSYTYNGSSFDNADTYTDFYLRDPGETSSPGSGYVPNRYYTKEECDARYAKIEDIFSLIDSSQVSMLKGKIIEVYSRLQSLYNALGEIAFWNGKPSGLMPDLDWGITKHTITFDLSGVSENVSVLYGGVSVAHNGTIQVEENTTVEFTVVPDVGYTLGEVTANGATVSGNTISLTVGQSDVTLVITATAIPQSYYITYQLSNCTAATGVTNPVTIVSETTAIIQLECTTAGYELALNNITVDGATKGDTLTVDNGVYSFTISEPESDVTISATATEVIVPTVEYSISYGQMNNCQVTTAPTAIEGNGTATIVFTVDTDYTLSQNDIIVTNADIISFTNNTLIIGNATGNVTVSATATAVITPTVEYSISYDTLSNCQATTAPTTITDGDTATIVFSVDTDYELIQSNITVTNASIVSFTNNTLVIGSATGNVTISATATAVVSSVKFLKGYYLTRNGGVISNAKKYHNSDPTNTDLTTLVTVSDYIQIPAPEDQTLTTISALCNWGRSCGTNTAGSEYSPGGMVYHQFYVKDNDTFIFVPNSCQGLKPSAAQGSAHNIQTYLVESGDNIVLNAYLSGNLYVRVSMFRSSSAGNLATNAFISVNSVKAFAANATPYTLVDSEDWTFDTNYDISYGTMTNCETTYAPDTISNGSTTAIVFKVDKKYELLQSNIIVTNATILSFGNIPSTTTTSIATLILGNPTGNVTVSATATSVSA